MSVARVASNMVFNTRWYANLRSPHCQQSAEIAIDDVSGLLYRVPKNFELKVKNWIRFQYVQHKKDLQVSACSMRIAASPSHLL